MNTSAHKHNHTWNAKLVKDVPGKTKHNTSKGLRELFINTLTDVYLAEKVLSDAIPKIIKNAHSEELLDTLFTYLENTNKHITRIGKVFTYINEKAETEKSEIIIGLLKEGELITEKNGRGVMSDTSIILLIQKVMHYKIAIYSSLFSFAKILGENDSANLLFLCLNNEREIDEILTNIAESTINFLALMEMLRSN